MRIESAVCPCIAIKQDRVYIVYLEQFQRSTLVYFFTENRELMMKACSPWDSFSNYRVSLRASSDDERARRWSLQANEMICSNTHTV